ncbi:hypothetical protein MA16_Dca000715 [Dendrobium catenatum]|uniref:Uncharacterized protein n=1 Tax=Dendrobium catenatum TaxID=906689 RepID=A0A2I0WUN3_9ASPA|nr:hypothetical protein MA16_Dca000715 [Dendrobium catenatum]
MKSAFEGPTSISPEQDIKFNGINHNANLPVVTRFFCPPEMPLIIESPTMVSAQISNPKIFNRRR